MPIIIFWKTQKIIAMALLYTMAVSLVSYYAFRNISISINETKSLVKSQLDEIRNPTQPPPLTTSSAHIVNGPNGSKDISFFVSVGLSVGASVSGEDERTYLLTLGFLEELGKIFDLLSNVSIVTAMTAFIVCVAVIISGLRKNPRQPIPSI